VEKRRSPRVKTRFDALYSSGREEGAGVLADISYSGARLAGTSFQPPVGTKVRLYVFIQPVDPFEVTGEVVRLTEDGFALEYVVADARLRRLVDDASALVAVPEP
jgi:hypothetical protein